MANQKFVKGHQIWWYKAGKG